MKQALAMFLNLRYNRLEKCIYHLHAMGSETQVGLHFSNL